MIYRPWAAPVLPLFILCLLPVGCARYEARPLTETAVNQALAVPDPAELAIQARELNHPIQKPLELDIGDGISPDEAAVLAILLNPSLRAERDRRALADAQLLQAGILPNPQVDVSLDHPSFGNTAGESNAWGVGIGWDLQSVINRLPEKAAASEREAVELDVAWNEWQVAEAAKMAVFDLIGLRGQVSLAEELEQRLVQNLDLTREAVDKGFMTELDLAAAESAVVQARARLLDLRHQEQQQGFQLRRLLGLPSHAPLTLQQDVTLPIRYLPPDEKALLAGLEDRRLDLVALRKGYESQEATVRAAIWNQFPNVTLGVNRASDTGKVGTTGFTLSFDLPIFDRNQGTIAIERATRQQLFDEYTTRFFQTRADIAEILATVESLNQQIAASQQGEPSLEKLVETYRVAVDKGQADVLSYYGAWNDRTESQMDRIALQQSLADARIALEIAAGMYGLSSGEPAALPSEPAEDKEE